MTCRENFFAVEDSSSRHVCKIHFHSQNFLTKCIQGFPESMHHQFGFQLWIAFFGKFQVEVEPTRATLKDHLPGQLVAVALGKNPKKNNATELGVTLCGLYCMYSII